MCNICSHSQNNNKHNITTVDGRLIKISELESHIQNIMDSIEMPGLSIAIINDKKIAYHNTFGVANNETEIPVTKASIFEAASLSKPLFAYFIMKMVAQDKIDLDEPIYPILKSLFTPNAFNETSLEYYKMITPRIVLSHGTGIPNWAQADTIPIAFKPGTGFSYSGEAYQHLGGALGTKLNIGWQSKLDSLFLKEVAHPLKMKRSFYTWNDTVKRFKVKGHKKGNVNLEVNRRKAVGPGYSLYSNAYDYALFLIEMMKGEHLSKELIDEMLKEQNKFSADSELLKETGQTGWGLGFAQKPTANGLMHLHTGNNHDFQAYCMFIPKQQYGLVLFTNSDTLFPFIEEIGKLIGEQF